MQSRGEKRLKIPGRGSTDFTHFIVPNLETTQRLGVRPRSENTGCTYVLNKNKLKPIS